MASHANEMAARLQDGLRALGIPLYVESSTNQIFPVVSGALRERLRGLIQFEDWCPGEGADEHVIRFVASFATSEQEVQGFLRDLVGLL